MFLEILGGVVVVTFCSAGQYWTHGNLKLLRRKEGQFCASPWRNGVRARSVLQVLCFGEGKTGFEPSMACEFCTLARGKRGSSDGCLGSFVLRRRENGVRALGSLRDLHSGEGIAGFEL